MTIPFPRPMTPEKLALEAELAEHGGIDRFERFSMVFAFAVADEFELDEAALDPVLRPLIDVYLPRRYPDSDGGRLGAMTNLVGAAPVLRDLGADDHPIGTVGV